MCDICWKEYGSPGIVTERTKACAESIAKVYSHSSVGGGLHIIVDDWNIEDSNVEFCSRYIESSEHRKDDEASNEQIRVERECLYLLKEMSLDERASALAINEGLLTV